MTSRCAASAADVTARANTNTITSESLVFIEHLPKRTAVALFLRHAHSRVVTVTGKFRKNFRAAFTALLSGVGEGPMAHRERPHSSAAGLQLARRAARSRRKRAARGALPPPRP